VGDTIFDFVIVGGGTAGCILANRLSADPGTRVLVVEAGQPDHAWDLAVQLPLAMGVPVGSSRYDWRYRGEPEPALRSRRPDHPRGKVLGGSSSINGMLYTRGHRADFDRWAEETGTPEWDYAHCLPYFRRLENCIGEIDDTRGRGGPHTLMRSPAAKKAWSRTASARSTRGSGAVGARTPPVPTCTRCGGAPTSRC
jgi:choline dehydrogenase